MAKKTENGKETGTALVARATPQEIAALRAELDEDIKADEAREVILGNKISIRGKEFKYGQVSLGKEFDGIIAHFGIERAYYGDNKYDPENPVPPSCFALSMGKETGMAPHEKSTDKQSTACDTCVHNRFGTADVGRGKRCREHRRLAVLAPDFTETGDAMPRLMTIPPTSLVPFKKLINSEAKGKFGLPIFAMVTQFTFKEDNAYPTVLFEARYALRKPVVDQVKATRTAAEEMIMRPYEPRDDGGKQRAGKTVKGRRKFTR